MSNSRNELLAALNAGAVSPEVAAAAAKGDLPEAGTAGAPAADTAAAPAAAALSAEDAAKKAADDEAAAAALAAEQAKPTPAPAPEVPSLVAHLRDEVKELRGELAQAQTKLAAAEQAAADLRASQPKLTAIVKRSAEVMAIALGSQAIGLDSMTPEALCQYHATLSEAMVKKFPVGGRAVVSADAKTDDTPARGTAAHPAAVQATGIK